MTINIEDYRAASDGFTWPVKKRKSPRRKPDQWFLKGPIPGPWLTRAARVSFRALRVGLALWYLAGVKKSHEVQPNREAWRRFGLSPDAGRRGLNTLAEAELVVVERRPGRYPTVTLLEVVDDQASSD